MTLVATSARASGTAASCADTCAGLATGDGCSSGVGRVAERKSKSRHTSSTSAFGTGFVRAAKPPISALSQMTLITRGTPFDKRCTVVMASREKTSAGTPPAIRRRPATYAAVSARENVRISQRSATHCLSCRSPDSFKRSASSGWPISSTLSSLSVVVSILLRSRTSSRSSDGRL